METGNSQQPMWPLNQIYFYLTRGCNLRCRHCWISPKFESEGQSWPSLDLSLFRSVIQQAIPLGLSGVKLTGGEPLIHTQIFDIIEYIETKDLALTVETNGVACTPELAKAMRGCKSALVSVSLDAAEAKTHEWMRGVKGSFEAAIQGVRNLVDVGLRPQIIMSLVRRNKDQMEAIVRLAETLGAESVKFNVVQPTARGEQMHLEDEVIPVDELIALGDWVEKELDSQTEIRVFFGHPVAFRPLGKMFGQAGDGCSECGVLGILGVLADGSYALCGIGETVPDLVFGHVSSNRLEEVWKGDSALNEIRTGLPKRLTGICGDCLMKSVCLGSCVAQNYYRGASLWAPFWYCEQAEKRGLFPESRLCRKSQ
jgi:SynChlorMet cassette radical SAM/SPASM protein ScmF